MTTRITATSAREALLLAIIFFPLALVFVGSRSLSKVPVGPVFLYDIAVALSVIGAVIVLLGNRPHSVTRFEVFTYAVVLLFPLVGLIRFLLSDYSRDALREFHPFLYLVYAVVVALCLRNASAETLRRGKRLVLGALVAFWVLVSFRQLNSVAGWNFHLEGFEYILELRKDADGLFLGLLAAAVFIGAARRSAVIRWALLAGVVGLHVQIGSLESRAAQLAAAIMLGLAVLFAARRLARVSDSRRSGRVVLEGLVTLTLAIALSLSLTSQGARVVGGISPLLVSPQTTEGEAGPLEEAESEIASNELASTLDSEALVSGEGTVRARLSAWTTLASWMSQDSGRFLLGAGLGTDYFWESGTREALMGTGERVQGENRWPHNFMMTTFALLGFPMAVLLASLIAWAGIRLWSRRPGPFGDLREIAALILVGVTIVSAFGVVFENPFGSLPFAWALGVAIVRYPGNGALLSTPLTPSPTVSAPVSSHSSR